MNQGWQCPVCKTVYAPHVDKCECVVGKLGYSYDQFLQKYFPNIANDEAQAFSNETTDGLVSSDFAEYWDRRKNILTNVW